jgi:hypothetical protein
VSVSLFAVDHLFNVAKTLLMKEKPVYKGYIYVVPPLNMVCLILQLNPQLCRNCNVVNFSDY